MSVRTFAAGLTGALLLAGLSSVVLPATASAAAPPQQGLGYQVTPAQPYLHNPDHADWTGSYVVGGKQVWCVDFAYLAPGSDEKYRPGQKLATKWGTPLDPAIAADISYLLLRYGNTTSADDAAALAHLLHTWTAAPQKPGQLDPSNDFRTIAYDAAYHLGKLPPSAQRAVSDLTADANANHGPWTTSVAAPTGAQLVGTPANWTVHVLNAAGKGLAAVPVTVTATDATLPNGTATQVLTTPADGGPLAVPVKPTGPNPKVVIALDSPADAPTAQAPLTPDVQQVVTTGGTVALTAQAATTAHTAPGVVRVLKSDAHSKAPIVDATLELTGADKASPAIGQDGAKLTGPDGKPVLLRTGVDGTASVPNLRTPQDVCVIETTPPPGYEQAFDPHAPPTACGTVTPGATLSLTLTNVPNAVPVAIPAGGAPTMTAMGLVVTRPAPGALIGFGVLLVVGAGLVGSAFARRARR